MITDDEINDKYESGQDRLIQEIDRIMNCASIVRNLGYSCLRHRYGI